MTIYDMCGHIWTYGHHGHLGIMDIWISWIFVYRGYLDVMDIWISWIFGYHGYLDIMGCQIRLDEVKLKAQVG